MIYFPFTYLFIFTNLTTGRTVVSTTLNVLRQKIDLYTRVSTHTEVVIVVIWVA